jgi:acyl carrier protein
VTTLLGDLAENRTTVTRETRLRDIEIDSLGMAELGKAIEDDFGARVGLADLDRLDSVSDLIELVDQGAVQRTR